MYCAISMDSKLNNPDITALSNKHSVNSAEPAREAKQSKARTQALAAPRSLKELVQGLHYIFEDDHIDVEAVTAYIASYKSKEEDWADKAIFDDHRYTRNLLDEGNGKFNLILLCWGEGQRSCIHDHSDSHCFMKMLDGSLKETKYSWPEQTGPMMPTDHSFVEKDQVAYINDSIGLHRVENMSNTKKAVSLHLYSPPFQMCQTFDEKDGHKVKCNVTFHTRLGEKVCYTTPPISNVQAVSEET